MYAGFVRKQGDIHTFEDEAFLRHMARGSVVVLALGAVAVLAFGACLALCAPALLDPGLSGLVGTSALDGGAIAAWLFAFVIATALSFIVHELVHGLCFKCFAPAGSKVTFGADLGLGMLYACADGVVFTRRQYLAALLAPSVVVTAALLALGCALGYPVWAPPAPSCISRAARATGAMPAPSPPTSASRTARTPRGAFSSIAI